MSSAREGMRMPRAKGIAAEIRRNSSGTADWLTGEYLVGCHETWSAIHDFLAMREPWKRVFHGFLIFFDFREIYF